MSKKHKKGKKAKAAVAAPSPATDARPAMKVSALAAAPRTPADVLASYALPKPPPGVIPENARIAQDEAMADNFEYAGSDAHAEGIGFMGYAYLAELTQRPEYRRPAETVAMEMTRKWIALQASGGEDKSEKIKLLTEAMEKYDVQAVFRRLAELDGFFGRAQLFIDLGRTDGPELKTKLVVSPRKIGVGSLKRLTVVEPMWTYPNAYNSSNPLRPDYFKPSSWFVMGQEVHATRLLTLVMREVPDLLKPAYAFGGLSLSQMCKPYVDNWLRTRQSVSDLVHSFSIVGLKTNLSGVLGGGDGSDLRSRANLFNTSRDNNGLFILDKETEELENIAIPLSGLDELQAQSQEHMAAVTGIPLVKLLGITPSGLNASSDGEVRCFYDWIKSLQERFLRSPIKTVLDIIQLSEFGEIDPGITFEFEPLWQLNEIEAANARKADADTAAVYITAGVIDPEEERIRLASSRDSVYNALDLSHVPEPPPNPEAEGEPEDEPEAEPEPEEPERKDAA